MALKRRQIAVILSVAWLGLLTILAAYALHSTNTHSLPIPNALSALTLALAPIAGITIETTNALATALASSPKHRRSEATSTIPPILLPSTLTIALLLIYETVIATLAGTRITPIDGLGCNLQEKWTEMWRGKEEGVKRIQDAFQCCGFRTGRDMAWPFPDAQHGVDACVVRYGGERTSGCLEAWRGEERKVAGMMLFVAVGVFVWMVAVVAVPVAQPKPLRNILQIAPPNGGEADDAHQRALDYDRYRDDDTDDADDSGDETSIRREVTNLNSQSNLASLVEGNRSRHSVYINDQDRWRRDS